MPTVLRSGPYRVFFFSNEQGEPPQVHVSRDDAVAKLWLEAVHLARNDGFSGREMGVILRLVREHRDDLLKAWHDFFGQD